MDSRMTLIEVTGPTHVVDGADLMNWTRSGGWKLVALVNEQLFEPFMEPNPHPREPNDYNYQSMVTVSRQTERVRYLIAQSSDVALQEACSEKSRAEQATQQALKELDKFRTEARAREAKLGEFERALKDLKCQHECTRTDAERERSARHKLENDIAKIRQAIGQIEMDRILAPAEEKRS